MNAIDALQGTDEWLAIRARHFTASEAPAMMGASKYTTRTELLRQKSTGIAAAVDDNKQRLFDRGHAAEAAARPIVEAIIGKFLYPETGALEIDGLPLLASFDGLTAMGNIAWESKLWNATLADAVRAGALEPHYYWQLEQQLLVSGAERVYFTTSDGTPEQTIGMWYEAVPGRREQLIAGWKQFAEDLANYQHVEHAERPAAEVSIELPALFIQAKGQIVDSNMVAYGEALKAKLAEVRAIVLATDQDFSNAKEAAKLFREQIKKIALTQEAMLSQTVTIGEATRMMDAWKEDLRLTALQLEKDVEKADLAKKAAIVTAARQEIENHVAALNRRIGGNWMPQASAAPYSEAIKNKRSYASMQDAVDTALAHEKIRLDGIAALIEANRKELINPVEGERDWSYLFPDFASICIKPTEDFRNLVLTRVRAEADRQEAAMSEAKAAEEARIFAAVEAERMKARQQETARLEAAARPVDIVAAATPEQKQAAVIEHQDEIAEFMASREWGKDADRIRAVLVEFVKFKAAKNLKVAA